MQIFISHSQKDQQIARDLRSELTSGGMRVWLAEEEVVPGANWQLEVGKALERCQAMVVLLSPEAVENPNVRHEIAYALSSPRFEGRLVPVIVKPTQDVPWILRMLPVIRLQAAQGPSIKRLAGDIIESLKKRSKEPKSVKGVVDKA